LIGLGSNVGKRSKNMDEAISLLSSHPRITVLEKSHFYITSPVGPFQRDFINSAVKIKTTLKPVELLAELKVIEAAMGRKKTTKWGPRLIDLDIIFYGGRKVKSKILTVPHKEAHKRLFVMLPVSELSPGFVHPVTGETVKKIASGLLKTSLDQKATKMNRGARAKKS